jgi:hypothetical protein
MRILAVLYCFPPLLVPAAVRYLKAVLGLRELGVEVEPLVIDPSSFAAPEKGLHDPALAALVPGDLRLHAVRSPENHPAVTLLKRVPAVRNALYRVFEPKKKEWLLAARREVERLDFGRFDAILTCSQPHANHLLGLELKRRHRLPWVAWFGDPWAANPYARPATPRIAAYHRELERAVLAAADRVFYTSPEMLALTRAGYPGLLDGKSGVLPHLFVPDWYRKGDRVAPRRARVEILHTGHFYGPRSPRPLIEALSRLAGDPSLGERLHVASYGSLPPSDREAIGRAGLGDVFETHPVVPYLDSLALMRGADVLLSVDAKLTSTEESVFLPSKLVDYLGAGRPVLALTPERGASARVIEETGGARCDVEDVDAIEAVLRGLAAGEPIPPPDPGKVDEYDYRRVAGTLLAALQEVAGKTAATASVDSRGRVT